MSVWKESYSNNVAYKNKVIVECCEERIPQPERDSDLVFRYECDSWIVLSKDWTHLYMKSDKGVSVPDVLDLVDSMALSIKGLEPEDCFEILNECSVFTYDPNDIDPEALEAKYYGDIARAGYNEAKVYSNYKTISLVYVSGMFIAMVTEKLPNEWGRGMVVVTVHGLKQYNFKSMIRRNWLERLLLHYQHTSIMLRKLHIAMDIQGLEPEKDIERYYSKKPKGMHRAKWEKDRKSLGYTYNKTLKNGLDEQIGRAERTMNKLSDRVNGLGGLVRLIVRKYDWHMNRYMKRGCFY